MRIPNFFITELSSTELLVACKLYSLVNIHTKINSKGFEICIKQETIARSCDLSISTVKRILAVLECKGIVLHKYRKNNAGGFLGAYNYTLKPFSFLSDYFTMSNHIFKFKLSPKLFRVYALCNKLKANKENKFYQSYKDLSHLLGGMKKSELIACMNELIGRKLIHKRRKKTNLGDYTDNTYWVIFYQQTKKVYKKRRKRTSTHKSSLSTNTYQRNFFEYIISQFFKSVKTQNQKILRLFQKNFSLDGGG